jgi:photosystem II stability/assembly factor-like uncharacterized protein
MKRVMFLFCAACVANVYSQTVPNFQDWVTSLAIDSSGIMYAGTSANGSGIYTSTDRGGTWRQTPMKYGVTTMAISRPGTILTFAFGQSYGRYLFRLSANGTLLDSVSLPFTPSSIIALRDGSLYAPAFGGGIYRSIDDGKNWSTYGSNPFPGTDLSELAVVDSATLIAASKDHMLRSTNAGADWEECNWGGHDSISVLALTVRSDGTVYAGVYEGIGAYAYEIFRSTNGGANWTFLAKLVNPIDVMAVDSAGTIFTGSIGGLCSISASGDTASIGPAGIAHNGYGIRTIVALRKDTVYAGAWGGVYETTNRGLSWTVMNSGMVTPLDTSSFTNSLPNGYAISCGLIDKNGALLVGTDSAGIFRSVDKGRTWTQTSLTLPFITQIFQDTMGSYYAGTAENGVYSSQNNGVSWTKIPDQVGLSSGRRFNCLEVSYNIWRFTTDTTQFIVSKDLMGGTDEGIFCNILNMMFPSWLPTWIMNGSYTAFCHAGAQGMLGFGSDGTICQRTVDDVSWINRSRVDQNVAAVVKISDTLIFSFGSRGVYRSDDTGLTWTQTKSGITDTSLISATVSSKGILFAGSTRGSIYRSTDGGEQWTLIATLPYPVRCILLDEMEILATSGARFYRSSLTEVSSSFRRPTVPERSELGQNYPNPFNPSTTFSYDLTKAGMVTLKVYDILGREIATLVNGQKQPGSYRVTFNGSSLVSGVYFYRLQAGEFSETKKLLLLK